MTEKRFTTDGREIPTILGGRMLVPPFKNKAIEFIRLYPEEIRARELAAAGYNTFQIPSEYVFIDFLTDSGTTAMSDRQWAGMMMGDESYAGSKSFKKVEAAVRDVFGYKEVIPTHQGRGAEHICAKVLIPQKENTSGWWIPNNLYFTTSRFHQENAGAKWIDVSVSEAVDPVSTFKWKGNIDISKLEAVILEKGAVNIPFVRIEASLNMAGGQPFSLANLAEVSAVCKKYGIFFLLDATRISDNAYEIQQKEDGYQNVFLGEIIKKICSYTDGCTMSSKKDHYVNIGGFFAVNNDAVAVAAKDMVVVFEGLDSYGGMAGYSMEALAQGIYESTDAAIVGHYVAQSRYMGEEFLRLGVPVVAPIGVHGVFLDAKRFVPHLPQSQFPAQSLASAIYEKTGIRGMERGIVSGQHGHEEYDGLELVRLTLPRRVYELAHLTYVVEAIHEMYLRRDTIKGLKMVYEPEALRFFRARFEPVE